MALAGDLEVETHGPGLYEITRDVADWLAANAAAARHDGVLVLSIRHTSASLLIQENADPDVAADLADWLSRIVPRIDDPGMDWVRHTAEGPDDMPAHLRAAILPTSLTVPVRDGALSLGTWQGLYVVEHRDRPHRRRLDLTLL